MYSTLYTYGHVPNIVDNQHFVNLPSIPLPVQDSSYQDVLSVPNQLSVQDPSNQNIHDSKNHEISCPLKNELLPVMDPLFNLREICKQSILLEDHLTHDDKRCNDCCTKHFLTLEALAEEAMTLDKYGQYKREIGDLAPIIRQLQKEWINNADHHEISQKLREIRKKYQQQCFNIIADKNCSSCNVSK